MKIGYPCVNNSIGCKPNYKFKLASFSPERQRQAVLSNLSCLRRTLEWNAKMGLLFFRIASETVPFASHPSCKTGWANEFSSEISGIGEFARKQGMRISMHPDQFVLLNSPGEKIALQSIDELSYHATLLELMGLGTDAKIQIHVGGVYGDRASAIKRFCNRFSSLPEEIAKRLVIENDDVSYPLSDCLSISKETGVPVLFDFFHHSLLNSGESMSQACAKAAATWKKKDGIMMADYSSQQPGARKGRHADSIDMKDFARALDDAEGISFDLMLEIKDKEKSALAALSLAKSKGIA